MIIRMTVEDNDYTELLEDFVDNLREHFFQYSKNYLADSSTFDNFYDIFECEENIRRAMWAQGPKVPDNISLNALEERLHILWGNYVDSGEQESAEKELLKRDFKTSFGFNYQEKWENGEVVYYFSTANKWISQ